MILPLHPLDWKEACSAAKPDMHKRCIEGSLILLNMLAGDIAALDAGQPILSHTCMKPREWSQHRLAVHTMMLQPHQSVVLEPEPW